MSFQSQEDSNVGSCSIVTPNITVDKPWRRASDSRAFEVIHLRSSYLHIRGRSKNVQITCKAGSWFVVYDDFGSVSDNDRWIFSNQILSGVNFSFNDTNLLGFIYRNYSVNYSIIFPFLICMCSLASVLSFILVSLLLFSLFCLLFIKLCLFTLFGLFNKLHILWKQWLSVNRVIPGMGNNIRNTPLFSEQRRVLLL